MGNNQIKELPVEIGQLVNLRGLNLEDNQIKEVPAEISQLVNLRVYINNWNWFYLQPESKQWYFICQKCFIFI